MDADAIVVIPIAWRATVRSIGLLRECDGSRSNILCDGDAGGLIEFSVPIQGELLPYRTPPSSYPQGFPTPLANGKRGNFHAYNPSLLVEPDGSTITIVMRWSNYNFCTKKANFDDNVKEAKGSLMSFVIRGRLNSTSWQYKEGKLSVWKSVAEKYAIRDGDIVSGIEDPRLIRYNEDMLLWAAVWEDRKDLKDGMQWQNLLRLRGRGANAAVAASGRLEVDESYVTPLLAPWLAQFGKPHKERYREKNWNPFVWKGDLYVEYSLEPRLVLKIDPVTYVGTPVLPLTSSAAARAWVHRLGPVSGGTPAVELPEHGVFLALGHAKLFKKKGRRTGNSHMMYKHFWYAFANMPPFALLGASLPFTLPTQLDETPSIQFATGLIYRQNTHELIVSYGELDCHATIARFPLTPTLEATLSRRREATPTPLLTALVVVAEEADDASGEELQGPFSSNGRVDTLRRLLPLLTHLSNVSAIDDESASTRAVYGRESAPMRSASRITQHA